MSRSIVWAQVGLLFIVLTAVLVDQERLPSFLFPPQILLALCFWSAFILPLAVIIMGACRKAKSGQFIEAMASVTLAVATLFAMLPLVQ